MKLVFLDLDNTLINAEYNLTAPEDELRLVVQSLVKRDIQVGLCSDSAVITLRQWAKRLGLTGPIIAERGAIIWDPTQQSEEVIEPSATGWFIKLRELFVAEIAKKFPEAAVMVGDATRFVKKRKIDQTSASQIFAINGFRKASFSFFACSPGTDKALLVPDSELLVRSSHVVAESIESFGKKKNDLFWDENPKYGILILHALTTEKRNGAEVLMNRFKPEQTVMVGDNMSDFLGLSNVLQYAVGNADSHYKQKAAFVSKKILTEGVIECLRQL